jgi:putative peptidoglycan lipid II flippase
MIFVLRVQIISLLFERGAFQESDTYLTATALLFYNIGMVPSCIAITIQGVFYAMKDTLTPLRISAFASLLNIPISFVLMLWLGLGGIALATSLISIFNIVILLKLLKRKIGYLNGYKMLGSFLKISLASIAMALAVWFISEYLDVLFKSNNQIFKLGVSLLIGFVSYSVGCLFFKVDEFREIITLTRVRFSLSR